MSHLLRNFVIVNKVIVGTCEEVTVGFDLFRLKKLNKRNFNDIVLMCRYFQVWNDKDARRNELTTWHVYGKLLSMNISFSQFMVWFERFMTCVTDREVAAGII